MAHHEIRTSKVSESGSANFAAVRSVGAVTAVDVSGGRAMARVLFYARDKVDSHFSLRSFNSRIGFARWYGVTLGEELSNTKRQAIVYHTGGIEHTLKWWIRDSMLSFMEARGGGTSLWSSTLTAPAGILLRH